MTRSGLITMSMRELDRVKVIEAVLGASRVRFAGLRPPLTRLRAALAG